MNKSQRFVPKRTRVRAPKEAADRRVRRTHQALVQALVTLVLEKRYDAITIQDLLNEADVGRTTFYAHYRGKDDFLFKSWERMLVGLDQGMDVGGTASPRVAPVRELFHHVARARPFHQALSRARVADRLYHVGTSQLSVTIERRLASLPVARTAVPAPVRARALAGALFALLGWWLEQGAPYTPEQMDQMYHTMAFHV